MTETKRLITLDWDDAGQLHLNVEGAVTGDHMVIGAFYLTRLAAQLADAAMAHAMAQPTIVPVHGKLRDARA